MSGFVRSQYLLLLPIGIQCFINRNLFLSCIEFLRRLWSSLKSWSKFHNLPDYQSNLKLVQIRLHDSIWFHWLSQPVHFAVLIAETCEMQLFSGWIIYQYFGLYPYFYLVRSHRLIIAVDTALENKISTGWINPFWFKEKFR